jgi:hypothetical protein
LARYVKCQYCNETIPYSEKDTLTKEVKVSKSTGKSKNLYYHPECYPKHIKCQEFLSKEKQERDELNEVVKNIYGVQYQLPLKFWEMVNDIRNGTNRYEKFWKKRYKKGIPYSVLKEAFLMSKADIEWARLNKRFRTLDQELRYGLVIAVSKANDAHRKIKAREQQEKMALAIEQNQLEMMQDDREVSYKNVAKKHDDISFILGDD